MVRLARSVGAEIVLINPASNLRDWPPLKSEHVSGLKADLQTRFADLLTKAREALKQGEPADALQVLDQARQIDDHYAELHFLRGRALSELAQNVEAKQAFVRARDEDICPLRARTSLRDVLARTARGLRIPVLDAAPLLETNSEHGIAGNEMFLDHVHPTLEGHRTIALALFDQLVRINLIDPVSTWGADQIADIEQGMQEEFGHQEYGTALRELSERYIRYGMNQQAVVLAQRATKMVPQDHQAWHQLGIACLKNENSQAAIPSLERALEIDPGNADTNLILGLALAHQGAVHEAIERLNAAIHADPDNEQAVLLRDRLQSGLANHHRSTGRDNWENE